MVDVILTFPQEQWKNGCQRWCSYDYPKVMDVGGEQLNRLEMPPLVVVIMAGIRLEKLMLITIRMLEIRIMRTSRISRLHRTCKRE